MSSLKHRLDTVQKTAVDRAAEMLNSDGKCLIVMSTGSGKTITASKIIQKLGSPRILWLTQSEELIAQTAQDLKAIFGEDVVSIYKAKNKEVGRVITVASVQTLTKDKNLNEFATQQFQLMIVDEAHHSRASSWEKIIRYFKCPVLGLTATPMRHDGQGLEELFGSTAFTLSYEEAKDLKLIASETYRVVLTNSKVEGVTTRTGEYGPEALDKLVISENRNEIIVDSYKKYGRTQLKKWGLPMKTICFCITVPHAMRMKKLFQDHGISSEILISQVPGHHLKIYGKQPQTRAARKQIYDAFVSNRGVEVLCVINTLSEGKNIPDVGCLLLARPTRSNTVYQQQVGRGCRRIEGKKENFFILDYVDLINQKYPPITMPRIQKKQSDSIYTEMVILDYFKGKDPVVLDEYKKYISTDFAFYPESLWSKEKIAKSLTDYFKKHGQVRGTDLATTVTGLPNRTTIKRFWPTVEDCFQELGITGKRTQINWTKQAAEKAILEFYKKNGNTMRITDLGDKNDLPSQKTVYKFWKTWSGAVDALDLFDKSRWKTRWTRLSALKSIRSFLKRKNRKSLEWQDFGRHNRLPSSYTIKELFSNLEDLHYALEIEYPKKNQNPARGVWRHSRTNKNFRSEIFHKKKRYFLGYFKTLEAAKEAYKQKHLELKGCYPPK